MDGRQLKAHNL